MEAALRTAYEVLTGKTLPRIDFEEVRGLDGIREATIPIPGVVDLKVAVVYGLKNARTIMEQIKAGNCLTTSWRSWPARAAVSTAPDSLTITATPPS
jgi:Iron only hydrogenase large subunit, C-terminal domain